MRDYEEQIKQLRECGSRRNCLDCPYDNDASYCIEPCITEAAAAIEELLTENSELKESVEYEQFNFDLACDHVEELENTIPKWVSVGKAPKDAETLIGYFGGGDYDQLRWYEFALVMDDGTVLPTRNANEVSNEHCIAVYALPTPTKENTE